MATDSNAAAGGSTYTNNGIPAQPPPSSPTRPPSSPRRSAFAEDLGPKMLQAPSSPVRIQSPSMEIQRASSATVEHGGIKMRRSDSDEGFEPPPPVRPEYTERKSSIRAVNDNLESFGHSRHDSDTLMSSHPTTFPPQGYHVRNISAPMLDSRDPLDIAMSQFQLAPTGDRSGTPTIHLDDAEAEANRYQGPSTLQYHHETAEEERKRQKAAKRASRDFVGTLHNMQTLGTKNDAKATSRDHSRDGSASSNTRPSNTRPDLTRSGSSFGLGADLHSRGRSLSPNDSTGAPSRPLSSYTRLSNSPAGRLQDTRPVSMVDLLKIPYSQQVAHQMLAQDNARLQTSVGTNAALLDMKKTLDMYRANVKKTNDSAIQYEFAIFMVNAVQEAASSRDLSRTSSPSRDGDSLANLDTQKQLLKEARGILQRLADKGYAYAQYYLADGYASGLFNNNKPDYDKAFSQFLAAGKHGHAEASYRTALCYEFGWGSRKDVAKAVQFHRQAASKGHPGAAARLGKACLTGDMGQVGKYREGIKWLKRATESADAQHNSAPYELGLLHVEGYGADIFKDESYAAQLFTQAAELGHPMANLRMGEVYEHGLLTCPCDPALSIHFYTGAAQAGVPDAMMALCAWYMVGAEPVLEKDESEAYEWALKAAEMEYAKAEYAVGYFTEMGIGCRRDPLEANVWYVRAADQGDERAKHRLAIIRSAETGDPDASNGLRPGKNIVKKKKSALGGEKKDDKDCIMM